MPSDSKASNERLSEVKEKVEYNELRARDAEARLRIVEAEIKLMELRPRLSQLKKE